MPTAAMAPAGPRPAEPRFTLLDPLRLCASFAVAWHHVTAGGMFLGVGFGLFLFFLMMVALATRSRRVEALPAFVGRKARHLLAPWVRWAVVYGLLQAAWDLRQGTDPGERLSPWMLLYGTRIELWFLPFALATLVAVREAQRLFARLAPRVAVLVATLVGLACIALADHGLARDWIGQPFDEWLGALPAIPLGLAIGNALRVPAGAGRVRLLAGVAGLVLAALALWPLPGGADLPRRYAVAACLAVLGFAWRPSLSGVVGRAARGTFGVYLLHPLVNSATLLAPGVAGLAPWPRVGLVWGLSLGAVHALARLGLRWEELPAPRAQASSPATSPPPSRSAAA